LAQESTTSGITLTLGELSEGQLRVVREAGGKAEACGDVYQLASRLAAANGSIREVCVEAGAITPVSLRLAALLKRLRPDVPVLVAPGSAGRRVDEALRAGLGRWEDAHPVAVAEEKVEERAVVSAPMVPATLPAVRRSVPATAWVDTKGNQAQPIVVRMAPKPVRENAAARPKADNTKLGGDKGSALEADALTRYDAMTSQPLLSDEELKALLEDPQDAGGENPFDV
jgi:hypothetical protein